MLWILYSIITNQGANSAMYSRRCVDSRHKHSPKILKAYAQTDIGQSYVQVENKPNKHNAHKILQPDKYIQTEITEDKPYPTTIVSNAHRTIIMQDNVYFRSKSSLSLIHSIIQYFINLNEHNQWTRKLLSFFFRGSDEVSKMIVIILQKPKWGRLYQMVQTTRSRVSNIHSWSFPNRV